MKKVLSAAVLCLLATAGCHLIGPPSDLVAYNAKGVAITAARVGDPVSFTCRGTDPFRIHLYKWDFGDGTVTEWDKIVIEHTYLEPGEYNVSAMERCPLIFGETCLMRTEWSASFVITVKEAPCTAQSAPPLDERPTVAVSETTAPAQSGMPPGGQVPSKPSTPTDRD